MQREKLDRDAIAAGLKELNDWRVEDEMLRRHLTFPDFAASLEFVNKVGELAEAADHHPDITFGWGYAEVALTTHDRDGVTDVDFALAKKIDSI